MRSIPIFILLSLAVFTASKAQDFQQNFDQSFAKAKDSDRQVLMIFSGSDWCKPCIQLRKEILTDPLFIEFSSDHLVLLELDFPYQRKNRLPKDQQIHNEQLAEQYNPEGAFPKVLLFDQESRVIGQVPYKKNSTATHFIEAIESLNKKI